MGFRWILLGLVGFLIAQEGELIRGGLLRGMATISPGLIVGRFERPFYLHGALAFYPERSVSILGDVYYYLGDMGTRGQLFEYRHQLFFGAACHWNGRRGDTYVGLQPGASLDGVYRAGAEGVRAFINPAIAAVWGYNYFIARYFHFFVQLQLSWSENISLSPWRGLEGRLSAGLGLQI